MIRNHFASILLTVVSLSLLAVLLASCAPATSTVVPTEPVTGGPSETLPPSLPTLDASVQATAIPTESLAPTPLPIATSRGPNLEAIDPTTVSLASGGIQFIEFFRFT
jgi:hypothetical protein